MATYTTRNRFIKPATNEFKNTWGDEFNAGATELFDFALDGWTSLDLSSAGATLTDEDGAADQARARVLNITATGGVARTVTIPSLEKVYKVRNAGTSTVLIKTSGGTGVVVLQGTSAWVFCDGTECYRSGVSGWGLLSSTTPSGATAAISIDVTGQKFNDLKVTLASVTPASSGVLSLTLTGAGGTTGTVNLAASASVHRGSFHILGYTHDYGIMHGNVSNGLSSDATISSGGTELDAQWRMAGGLTSFTLTPVSSTFSSGTVKVWLR